MIWIIVGSILLILLVVIINPRSKRDSVMEAGYKYMKKGDLQSAITAYTLAIEAQPDKWFAYYQRGQCYEKQGERQLAISDYEKAIALDPKYSDLAKKALKQLQESA